MSSLKIWPGSNEKSEENNISLLYYFMLMYINFMQTVISGLGGNFEIFCCRKTNVEVKTTQRTLGPQKKLSVSYRKKIDNSHIL